jgi:hypothetical protein
LDDFGFFFAIANVGSTEFSSMNVSMCTARMIKNKYERKEDEYYSRIENFITVRTERESRFGLVVFII